MKCQGGQRNRTSNATKRQKTYTVGLHSARAIQIRESRQPKLATKRNSKHSQCSQPLKARAKGTTTTVKFESSSTIDGGRPSMGVEKGGPALRCDIDERVLTNRAGVKRKTLKGEQARSIHTLNMRRHTGRGTYEISPRLVLVVTRSR